jgi:hypothetical protein
MQPAGLTWFSAPIRRIVRMDVENNLIERAEPRATGRRGVPRHPASFVQED